MINSISTSRTAKMDPSSILSETQEDNLKAPIRALLSLLREIDPHSKVTKQALYKTLKQWKVEVSLKYEAETLERRVRAIDQRLRQNHRDFAERMVETQQSVGTSLRRAAKSDAGVLPRWYGLLQQFPLLSAVFETPAVACFDVDFSDIHRPQSAPIRAGAQGSSSHHNPKGKKAEIKGQSSAARHNKDQDLESKHSQQERQHRAAKDHQQPKSQRQLASETKQQSQGQKLSQSAATLDGHVSQRDTSVERQARADQRLKHQQEFYHPEAMQERQAQDSRRKVLRQQRKRYRQLQRRQEQLKSLEEQPATPSMPGSFLGTVADLSNASTPTPTPIKVTPTSRIGPAGTITPRIVETIQGLTANETPPKTSTDHAGYNDLCDLWQIGPVDDGYGDYDDGTWSNASATYDYPECEYAVGEDRHDDDGWSDFSDAPDEHDDEHDYDDEHEHEVDDVDDRAGKGKGRRG